MRARFLLVALVAVSVGVSSVRASGVDGEVPPLSPGLIRSESDSSGPASIRSLIVKTRSGRVLPGALLSRVLGGSPLATRLEALINEVTLVHLAEPVDVEQADDLAADLAADPAVEWAEPNKINRHFGFPDDPPNDQYWTDLWSLWDDHGVGIGTNASTMSAVWTQGRGAGVTVAVLDTGYIAHPDLNSQIVDGYDFVSGYYTPYLREYGVPASYSNFDGDVVLPSTYGKVGRDSNALDPGDWSIHLDEDGDVVHGDSSWHGTHVAGIVAATANNTIGVAGVAPNAKIQPIRVMSWVGGEDSDVADAIRWASGVSVRGAPRNRTPAKVISLSLGGWGACGSYMQSAINAAVARGSIVVVAAGNESDDALDYSPANCNNVVTVAATGPTGDLAGYSNFGDGVEIAAPGGDVLVSGVLDLDDGILSTLSSTEKGPGYPGYVGGAPLPSYASNQGTSMATPLVAGAIATLWSARSTWTAEQVLDRLYDTARTPGPDCLAAGCGAGIVDLAAALEPSRPDSPTGVKVSAGSGSGRVSWRPPGFNGGSTIISYTATAYASASGGAAIGTCTAAGLSCTISGLGRRVFVHVEVIATNAVGDSEPTAPRVRFRTR